MKKQSENVGTNVISSMVTSVDLNSKILAQENILLVYGRDPKNKLKSFFCFFFILQHYFINHF